LRKKIKKIAITALLAFGLFINFSSTIHAEVNKPAITIDNLTSKLKNDPIIGDH